MGPTTLRVGDDDDGRRLDRFVADSTDLSRARVQALIADGSVTVDGRTVTRASRRVRPGQTVVFDVPPPRATEVAAEAIPMDIVFEDSDLLVVHKPAGMVVHPAPGHPDGTLVNALLHHCDDLSGVGGELRPGIVHRIDKDTSGLLVVSKNDATHHHLQAQFAAHTIERTYLALCARTSGPGLEESGTLATPHGRHPKDRKRFTGRRPASRTAVTHYRVTGRFADGAVVGSALLDAIGAAPQGGVLAAAGEFVRRLSTPVDQERRE